MGFKRTWPRGNVKKNRRGFDTGHGWTAPIVPPRRQNPIGCLPSEYCVVLMFRWRAMTTLWSYTAGDTTVLKRRYDDHRQKRSVARRHVTRGRYRRGNNRRRWTYDENVVGGQRATDRSANDDCRNAAVDGNDPDGRRRPRPWRTAADSGLSIVVRVIVIIFTFRIRADNARAPVGRVATVRTIVW